jgi:hypothetical protein
MRATRTPHDENGGILSAPSTDHVAVTWYGESGIEYDVGAHRYPALSP